MKLEDLTMHKTAAAFLRSAPKTGPKIATVDIENFPMLSYHWSMFKQFISPLQVVEDWSLMSFAFKWLEQPDVFYADMRGAKDMRDDTRLLLPLHSILSNVDMVVAQNGQKFDIPKIKARMAERRMAPIPPIKVIDTMLHNKKEFNFSSNSLAFVSPKFAKDPKTEHQQFPGFHLWLECMKDNRAAWNECRDYNITDVTSTEEMYLALRPWYQGHHNLGPYIHPHGEPGSVHVCEKCGSTDVQKKGVRPTQVGIYQRYRCNSCGGWSRGRNQIRSRDDRAHILMS